jgi:hypothetical protein
MSDCTRTFEGPDLSALLERVQDELGDDAVIVGAEKVRSGGIGGFFQRERFEVTVDAGGDGAPGDDRGDDAGAPVAGPADATPCSIDDLVARVDAREASGPAAPAVSTESPEFAAVLQRLMTEAEPAAPATAPAAPPAAARAEAARELAPESIPPVGPEPEVPAVPLPAAPRAAAPRPAAPPPPVRDAVLLGLGLPPSLAWELPPGLDVVLALEERFATLPAPPPVPSEGGSVIAVVGPRARALALARGLAVDLGAPAADVVLAPEAGRPSGLPRRVTVELADAETRRRSWWRRSRPTVVAVEDDRELGRDHARQLLAALEPSLTVGVVEAAAKPDDLAAWITGLGGVDALVVDATSATASPASVLALGVPVALLDDLAATPAQWAALLAARIAA